MATQLISKISQQLSDCQARDDHVLMFETAIAEAFLHGYPSTMCYFAHFGLMINSDFPSKCAIFHARYWCNISNFCQISWVHC